MKKLFARFLFIISIYLLWLFFIRIYDVLPHLDITKFMENFWFQTKSTYFFFYNFLKEKILFLKLFEGIYIYGYSSLFFLTLAYFIRKINIFDKILLSCSFGILIISLIYLVFEAIPPRLLYNISLIKIDEAIFHLITHPFFSFPSLHIFFTSIFTFFFLKYSDNIFLKIYPLILNILYPIVIFSLAMHWLIDVFPSYLISYISYKMSENKKYLESFRNKIIEKYEKLIDKFYSFYSSFLNKICPFK